MDFCGIYDKQIAEHYQTAYITPLLIGWEFRQKPVSPTGTAAWMALAKSNDWELPATIRHDLQSGEWAVVITDAAQVIQYVNTNFEHMTGYHNREVVGRRPVFLQGAETDPLSRHRIRKALEKNRIVDERVLNYRKDRSKYWCHIVIKPIVNRQKQVVNFIAFEQEFESDELSVQQ